MSVGGSVEWKEKRVTKCKCKGNAGSYTDEYAIERQSTGSNQKTIKCVRSKSRVHA